MLWLTEMWWTALQLDYKVDDKMLKDVFKISGKVVNVEISKDQDGKSRGFGVVGKKFAGRGLGLSRITWLMG